ncbi:hypothetical protein [Kitasatospora sp. KL5]|uniref:hypothetical protein n=1 Tax=Kitasatospora sp. KL5 TaxID=3425125 RepID=UPI003D6FBCFA
MNPQWVLPAVTTAVFLPPAALLASGRVPARWRSRLEPVRLRGLSLPGLSLLGLYLSAPANGVPRTLGAGFGVVLLCSAAGLLCALGGPSLLVVAGRRQAAPAAGRADEPR